MTLQKITELDAPAIEGKWYLVPCVRAKWSYWLDWWPVFPVHHEDSKHFPFKLWHYHVDVRFVGRRMIKRAEGRAHYSGRFLSWEAEFQALPISHADDEPAPEVVWKRRRCQRVGTPYGFSEEISKILAPDYIGKVCPKGVSGWVCPHKGFDMSSIEPDKFGNVTCPMHGLQINTVSGVVVGPRPLHRARP